MEGVFLFCLMLLIFLIERLSSLRHKLYEIAVAPQEAEMVSVFARWKLQFTAIKNFGRGYLSSFAFPFYSYEMEMESRVCRRFWRVLCLTKNIFYVYSSLYNKMSTTYSWYTTKTSRVHTCNPSTWEMELRTSLER